MLLQFATAGLLRLSIRLELFHPLLRKDRVKKKNPLPVALPLIRVVRGLRVILDSDLARLYGVTTSRLNEQTRRNKQRFPVDFAFTLTRKEAAEGLSQIATALGGRNRSKPPVAYTEHGAVMAANVLKSKKAVTMSVEVIRAFVQLRKIASSHGNIERILAELETAVAGRLDLQDKKIESLFRVLELLIQEIPEKNPTVRRFGTA
jgi:hypothetical protein